ncbi:MAG: hypothetical protein ACLQKA_07835 [Bryobacteraceae bacterium]
MGSVSSANPGVANLLQMLSASGSPVLSSPKVTSALEKASATDIVQLSMDAIQSQGVGTLFGIPSGANADAGSNSVNLADLLTESTGASATSPVTDGSALLSSAALPDASPADQLAYYQSAAQTAQTQSPLNAETFGSQSGSLVDVVG